MTKDQSNIEHVLREQLGNRTAMPMDEFVDLALYHHSFGYYSINKKRVGKAEGTDFYTSNTLGTVWGELIVDACTQILDVKDLAEYTFVEIAAEPGCSVLDKVDHPFSSSISIRLGDPLKIPDRAIVFSNEWLDAQPFKRFRFDTSEKKWREIGVGYREGKLTEYTISQVSNTVFPDENLDGYTIDWPIGSIRAMNSLLARQWKGLFLTFDYGLSKPVLLNERPDGTARAYHQHQMNGDLFANAGKQDLTCHLCWDELTDCLKKNLFKEIGLLNQESFFMKYAQKKIRNLIEQANNPLDSKVQKLKELIHPQHFGSKFQVLWGKRD
jgi:SAM-dependent MidA family methyltransferase